MGIEATPLVAPVKVSFPRRIGIQRSIGDCELSPRRSIAIYKSHVPAMDEGWTRWVLKPCSENEEITDEVIRASRFEQGTLSRNT